MVHQFRRGADHLRAGRGHHPAIDGAGLCALGTIGNGPARLGARPAGTASGDRPDTSRDGGLASHRGRGRSTIFSGAIGRGVWASRTNRRGAGPAGAGTQKRRGNADTFSAGPRQSLPPASEVPGATSRHEHEPPVAAAGQAHRGPDILTPILLAFSIASILDPVVDWLAAWHVPRPAAIALVLGGTLGPVALVLVLVVPGIATDVAGGLQEMPTPTSRGSGAGPRPGLHSTMMRRACCDEDPREGLILK